MELQDRWSREHTANTYRRAGCRCEKCRTAMAEWNARHRARRKARLATANPQPVHGRESTYTGWGCRCDECRTAATEAKRKRGR